MLPDQGSGKPSRQARNAAAPKVMRERAECFIGAAFAATIASTQQRTPMQAYVYKSRRKSDTYVYLRERDGFGLIPEPLRASLGALDFVLELALTPDRKLAQTDPAVAHANLVERGFHMQFPPHDAPSWQLDDNDGDA